MAYYQRNRIWEMVEGVTTHIQAIFKREGKWIGKGVWKTPEARRCQLKVVDEKETKGFYMLHCCVFPKYNSPIYGLSICATTKRVDVFHDFTPVQKDHSMVPWFAKEVKGYTPSKVRELPDWATKIYSPNVIAATNITKESELMNALSLVECNLGVYFTLLRRYDKEVQNTQEIEDTQNRYKATIEDNVKWITNDYQ
jgi:hypothetical protein